MVLLEVAAATNASAYLFGAIYYGARFVGQILKGPETESSAEPRGVESTAWSADRILEQARADGLEDHFRNSFTEVHAAEKEKCLAQFREEELPDDRDGQ
ncbi:unnamed protein product, partial [Symbiodinium sp. CCMP2592]